MYENQRLLRFSSTLGWKMWNFQNMKMKRLLVKNNEKIEEMNVGHAGSDWKWFLWNEKFWTRTFFESLNDRSWVQQKAVSNIQEHRKCLMLTSRNIGSALCWHPGTSEVTYRHPGTSEVPYADIQEHRKCHMLTSRNMGSAICSYLGTSKFLYSDVL